MKLHSWCNLSLFFWIFLDGELNSLETIFTPQSLKLSLQTLTFTKLCSQPPYNPLYFSVILALHHIYLES